MEAVWQALVAISNYVLEIDRATKKDSPQFKRQVATDTDNLRHPVTPCKPAFQSASIVLPTVRSIADEVIAAKARAKKSVRYIRSLRNSLLQFAAGRENHLLSEVTAQDVEQWLFGAKTKLEGKVWAPHTMKTNLGDVRMLYNFAFKRGYIPNMHAVHVILPADEDLEPPTIHAPEQVKKLLDYAFSVDADVGRILAVRYFAGVRSGELHKMREKNILFEHGVIEVPARAAKTRARRLVTIQPNLARWFERGGTLRAIRPDTIRRVIRGSGVDYPHNVARHSFVSYHLAKFKSENLTAMEAGNSPQIIISNYRCVVLPKAVDRYWGVVPDLVTDQGVTRPRDACLDASHAPAPG